MGQPHVTEDYARAFEAGALAALDRIAEQYEDLEDVTLETAEYIGGVIDLMLGRREFPTTNQAQQGADEHGRPGPS